MFRNCQINFRKTIVYTVMVKFVVHASGRKVCTYVSAYKSAYRSSWEWFTEITDMYLCVCVWLCVCVCWWGGGSSGVFHTLCEVTYRNFWHQTVHLIPEQVTCFGKPKLLILIPFFFAYSYSISPSSYVLFAPFYDTLPRPTNHYNTHGLRNCLSAATFHSEVIRYSDNWMWLPT